MAAGKHRVDVLDGALVPLATCGNPVMMGANASANAKNNAGCSTTGKAYQCKCHGYGGRNKSWCGF